MGKSFELLGLAGFNVFLALILSVVFLPDAEKLAVKSLSEENVAYFIHEVSSISNGEKEEMDSFGITDFFIKHIQDGSVFQSTISYDAPGRMGGEQEVAMDKMTFISRILSGLKEMNDHEAKVVIEHIEIMEGGQKAMVMTTNYERGLMPVDDGFGEIQTMPVTGTSFCEQTLVLNKNIIQMAGAQCTTDMTFASAY